MAYQLGCLKRAYDGNGMVASCVENLDETHMVCDLDVESVLDFRGAKRVTYQEVSGAGQGFSIVMRVSGGYNAKIEVPMVILQNAQRNYPMQSTPDDIPGVCYRTQAKAWMDNKGFAEYFRVSRTIGVLPGGQTSVLFIDNCKPHVETPELLEALLAVRTELRRFPKNCTHLIQQLILKLFKDEWRKRWDAKKYEFILAGRIAKPPHSFYLNLVKE